MQLNPGEKFTISRQLFDPNDTDTNYVRAVIRNAVTDAVIKTVNLTDKGSRRFTSTIDVPADVSGQGFYVTITSSVYTDASYTTYNQNYGEEQNTYLVQARKSGLEGGGGHGGFDVDYSKIEKMYIRILNQNIDILKAYINSNKPKPIDLTPVTTKLNSILDKVTFLCEDETKSDKDEMEPLLDSIKSVESTLSDIKECMPKTNTDTLHEAFEALQEMFTTTVDSITSIINDLPAKQKQELEPVLSEIKSTMSDVKAKGYTLKLDTTTEDPEGEDGTDDAEEDTTEKSDPRIKKLMENS